MSVSKIKVKLSFQIKYLFKRFVWKYQTQRKQINGIPLTLSLKAFSCAMWLWYISVRKSGIPMCYKLSPDRPTNYSHGLLYTVQIPGGSASLTRWLANFTLISHSTFYARDVKPKILHLYCSQVASILVIYKLHMQFFFKDFTISDSKEKNSYLERYVPAGSNPSPVSNFCLEI